MLIDFGLTSGCLVCLGGKETYRVASKDIFWRGKKQQASQICWRQHPVHLLRYTFLDFGNFRPMKGNPKQSWIQDFMRWIPYSRHWIPVFVNETWILDSTIVSGIPDSLSCIQDSKAQHFHFHKQNFPDPRIRIPLHVWVLTGRIFKSRRPAFLVLGVGCLFWSPAS